MLKMTNSINIRPRIQPEWQKMGTNWKINSNLAGYRLNQRDNLMLSDNLELKNRIEQFRNRCFHSNISQFHSKLGIRPSSICPAVHLRPHFNIFNSQSSKIRQLVHLKMIILVQCPNPTMRWTLRAWILVRCPHGWVDRPLTVRGGLLGIIIYIL